MKKFLLIQIIACLILPISITVVFAQEETTSENNSSQEIANKLANPASAVGAMINLFDYYSYTGDLSSSAQSGFRYTFQPSLPYPLKNGYNLFFRPLIPVNIKQPVYEGSEFTNAGADLGDISLDLAVGKTFNKKWLGIIGVFSSLPTATDNRISTGQLLFGPEIAYGRAGKWGTAVILLTQGWSLTKNGQEGRQSVTGGQYIYNINIGKAWQISGGPTFSYNHKASSGNKFTFPIGTGIKKLANIGDLPVSFSVQYYYYVARPDNFGPEHQVRLQIVPVVKLPW